MKKTPRFSLVCLFAIAVTTPVQAGFLDAVVSVGANLATQGETAAPQAPLPQIDNVLIGKLADELMDTLAVPAKTKKAKRAEVIKKLETTFLVAQRPSQNVSALAGAAGGHTNQAMQIAQAAGAMQQGGGMVGALAMLGGGSGNQVAQTAMALGGVQQGGAGLGGAMGLLNGAGGNTAKALQIVNFLTENPDLMSQLKGMAKQSGSSVDLSSSLNAMASRLTVKNPKSAQVVKFMADNPELTKQMLSLAGQTVSDTGSSGGGIMSSIKGIFGGSDGADAKPASQTASSTDGGFFGGLKSAFQNNSSNQGGESSSQPATFGSDSSF